MSAIPNTGKKATGKRAITAAQKLQRRRLILDSADAHLSDVGYEGFSMAKLGKLAGVAKGTLYLYFETREDVLLVLCCEKMAIWSEQLASIVEPASGDAEFVQHFYDVMCADPNNLTLLSRLDSVIEHNVSLENLIATKRVMAGIVSQLAEALAPKLQLSVEKTNDAVVSLTFLWMGTAQLSLGPELEAATLPDDVRQFVERFTSDQTFSRNACRILAGIRAGL